MTVLSYWKIIYCMFPGFEMDPNHKKILLDNRLELVRNVIVNEELLAVLRIDNVITADMQETIEVTLLALRFLSCSQRMYACNVTDSLVHT